MIYRITVVFDDETGSWRNGFYSELSDSTMSVIEAQLGELKNDGRISGFEIVPNNPAIDFVETMKLIAKLEHEIPRNWANALDEEQ